MEIPKCKDCGQSMLEVGGIGKVMELGEYRDNGLETNGGQRLQFWYKTGQREIKLYQCPEDKTIVLE